MSYYHPHSGLYYRRQATPASLLARLRELRKNPPDDKPFALAKAREDYFFRRFMPPVSHA